MTLDVTSELQGTIVGVFVEPGDTVRTGAVVALIESMKMHHEAVAAHDGTVTAVLVRVGDAVISWAVAVFARSDVGRG